MSNSLLSGKIEIRIENHNQEAYIEKFFAFDLEDNPYSTDDIVEILNNEGIVYGYSTEIIEFYLESIKQNGEILYNILIAQIDKPLKKGAENLSFISKYPYSPLDEKRWKMIDDYLRNFTLEKYSFFPFPVLFVHKGETIARFNKLEENLAGKNFLGEEILPNRNSIIDFSAGEGVFLDKNSFSFVAGTSGYLIINNNNIHVRSPFYLTKDKYELYFINLPRFNDEIPTNDEILDFAEKASIKKHYIIANPLQDLTPGIHSLLASGKQPTESFDAELEIKFTLETTVGKVDEKGVIDFKEKKTFTDVEEGTLLAIKKNPITGKDGENLVGNPLPARHPKDVIMKTGMGLRIDKGEKYIKYYAATDGIIDYKNEVLSIFPTITISGDVNYGSGNVKTKVNVFITGNVSEGFKVVSDKNITINGAIEDNTYVYAKGDIYVKGGIIGENANVECDGNLTAKYVENANIKCKGNINIQRFINNGDIICGGNMIVFGHAINLNERGAIVNSIIKIKKNVMVPVIGSDANTPTEITLGYDPALLKKIENYKTILEKIDQEIIDIKAKYEEDITLENILTIIKDYARSVKDDIINSIKKIQTIQKKKDMVSKILERENFNHDFLLKNSKIDITQKCFPTIIIHMEHLQLTIDKMETAKTIYYNPEEKVLEIIPFVV